MKLTNCQHSKSLENCHRVNKSILITIFTHADEIKEHKDIEIDKQHEALILYKNANSVRIPIHSLCAAHASQL